MAVSFVGKGAFASATTGNLTVAQRAGVQQGNFLLLLVNTANQPVAAPSGWAEVANSPSAQGTAAATTGATAIQAFYKFAGAAEGSVVCTGTSSYKTGIILEFSGVDTTSPINVTAASQKTTATGTALTLPAVTTTAANAMVVLAIGLDRDAASTAELSGWTNANLTGLTEQHDQTVTSGVGGGIAVATGVMASAGSTGTTSATLATASTLSYLTIALTEAVAASGAVTFDPANKAATITLSGGDLSWSASGLGSAQATVGYSTGKYYWEHTTGTADASNYWSGFGDVDMANAADPAFNPTMHVFSDGELFVDAAVQVNIGAYTTGSVVCHAVDLVNNLYWARVNNGNWNGNASADPATGVGGYSIAGFTKPIKAFAGSEISGNTGTANFGATAFAYTVPSGFSAYDPNAGTPAAVTAAAAHTLALPTSAAAANVNVSASIAAQTLSLPASSATASLKVSGVVAAQTLSLPVSSAAASPKASAAASQTLTLPTSSAVAATKVSGALAQTLSLPVSSSAAASGVTGSLAQTLALPLSSAAGATKVTGALAHTLALPLSAAQTSSKVEAAHTQILTAPVTAATGEVLPFETILATAVQTLPLPISAAMSEVNVSAAATHIVSVSSVATATSSITAVASQVLSLPASGISADVGGVRSAITASLVQVLSLPVTVVAAGSKVQVTASQNVVQPLSSATAAPRISAQAAQIVGAPVSALTGTVATTGAVTASAVQVLPLPANDIRARVIVRGVLAQVLPLPISGATAVVVVPGQTAPVEPALVGVVQTETVLRGVVAQEWTLRGIVPVESVQIGMVA